MEYSSVDGNTKLPTLRLIKTFDNNKRSTPSQESVIHIEEDSSKLFSCILGLVYVNESPTKVTFLIFTFHY